MHNTLIHKSDVYKKLIERNQNLRKEIAYYEDLENNERRNIFCSKETYSCIYYKRLPLSFIDTVFYTHAKSIVPYVNCTFEDHILNNIIERLKRKKQETITLSFAMLCIGVTKTKDGPILILQEPFKILQTKPLKKTKLDTARSWINRIIIVDLELSVSAKEDDEFEAKRVKVLNLTRSGIIQDGEEQLISWCDNMVQLDKYYNYTYAGHKRILEHYKDATGRAACMNALAYMEYYYNDKFIIPTYRENENTLWIRFEEEVIGIFYHNDILEMIYKNEENIKRLFNPDGTMTWYTEWHYEFTNAARSAIHQEYDVMSESEFLKKAHIDACTISNCLYSDLIKASRI